jgi:hypothetical protein
MSKLEDFLLYLMLYLGDSLVSSKNSLDIVDNLCYLLLNRAAVSTTLVYLPPDLVTPGEFEFPLSDDF